MLVGSKDARRAQGPQPCSLEAAHAFFMILASGFWNGHGVGDQEKRWDHCHESDSSLCFAWGLSCYTRVSPLDFMISYYGSIKNYVQYFTNENEA